MMLSASAALTATDVVYPKVQVMVEDSTATSATTMHPVPPCAMRHRRFAKAGSAD
jgi:hypothetical protein